MSYNGDRLAPERLLRAAHRLVRRKREYCGKPLWSFIGDMTGHGSTISMDICKDFGWNPHANVNADLPRAAVQASGERHG